LQESRYLEIAFPVRESPESLEESRRKFLVGMRFTATALAMPINERWPPRIDNLRRQDATEARQ